MATTPGRRNHVRLEFDTRGNRRSKSTVTACASTPGSDDEPPSQAKPPPASAEYCITSNIGQ